MAPSSDDEIARPPSVDKTYYSLLGISEDVRAEEIAKAYRHAALLAHPDKGGDDGRFEEIKAAYRVLNDPKSREDYDKELARERERSEIVLGGRANKDEINRIILNRVKTAPHAGSKRSRNPQHCSDEWKGIMSGSHALKAIADQDLTPEATTEQLFERYAALPRGKEKKQQWMNSLNGHQKFELKRVAKEHEKKELEKWQNNWLNKPPPKAKPTNKQKGYAHASKAPAPKAKAKEASDKETVVEADKVVEANKQVEAVEVGN
eukprot:gnl/TRDRNA2_/TRDRNA2_178973_c0_seq1.p1 gnl/TRDRNA2_/TRDRNA2_178973_c0~~gnl/TRDRNA2_/TRDRNA2_178973_c0_seq1.p1  ORF type:complete len:263 (-),score=86.08 gnl/TRDRNA2_/TRDRNA2_178973_c0_seq1:224-1012(-)